MRKSGFFEGHQAESQAGVNKEDQVRRMDDYLAEAALRAQEEGLPVRKNFRLEILDFQRIFPEEEIKRDLSSVDEREKEIAEKENEKGKGSEVGEHFELFKTALFHKFFDGSFVVVRSSRYDDLFHGVDNVILDRESGDIVCAFDEVTTVKEPGITEKREKVTEINSKCGAELKYGLGVNAEGRIVKRGGIKHLPLFYLALPEQVLYRVMESFNSSRGRVRPTEGEIKIVDYLVTLIEGQLKGLFLEVPFLERQEGGEEFIRNLKRFSGKSLPKIESALKKISSK
jgi:hypothetical protein